MSQGEGKQVNAVEVSLAGMLRTPGLVGAVLVDAVTGLVHARAGNTDAVGDGPELAELAVLMTDRLNASGADGDVESVVVTTARWYQVTQSVPRFGDGLLLCVVFDRERTNLALAVRETSDHARLVLA
ncbi:hypothetical protein GXW82_04365 [Streptacidiphilus sp. 4-A2]|nr:hypothetical protein [Streptacidiphilus sp. 4-A2]